MNPKFYIILIISFLLYSSIFAQQQVAPNSYMFFFADKQNSNYSVKHPDEFLSEKAILRRKKQKIRITEQDLPVSQNYIDSIKNTGVEIYHISKWYNAVCVKTDDSVLVDKISNFSFVQNDNTPDCNIIIPTENIPNDAYVKSNKKKQPVYSEPPILLYGKSATQITMLNGHILHNKGFTGQGMDIAVIDGGFLNANKQTAFKHLWENNRIKGCRDLVTNDTLSYNESHHGTKVLSILAANIPKQMIGGAPDATYWLYRTENASSEYKVEEFLWAVAAEKADSAGVDIITSSLGYSEFDDKNQTYKYSELDGCNSLSSIAADIASSKGILVVCSAGNERENNWQYITPPADAKYALTVGAINKDSILTKFSSVGPTADRRIKPNIVALGRKTTTQSSSNKISTSNGTSFACPVITGLAACLWQSHPRFTNLQLKRAIEKSSNQYLNPDSLFGYGVPDFYLAYCTADTSLNHTDKKNKISVFPNPVRNELNIEIYENDKAKIIVELFNLFGKLCYTYKNDMSLRNWQRINISSFSNLPKGIYILHIKVNETNFKSKIIKI